LPAAGYASGITRSAWNAPWTRNHLIIRPRAEDVEGQPILRPLPSAKCRSVGPFVFFDHMLETDYPPGKGMNIRQHPHIGLSTLTYLFEGQIQHKDSLGPIRWSAPVMSAG
jgi:redox-sensitive bicupin YhaK (pirin superfamily)